LSTRSYSSNFLSTSNKNTKHTHANMHTWLIHMYVLSHLPRNTNELYSQLENKRLCSNFDFITLVLLTNYLNIFLKVQNSTIQVYFKHSHTYTHPPTTKYLYKTLLLGDHFTLLNRIRSHLHHEHTLFLCLPFLLATKLKNASHSFWYK